MELRILKHLNENDPLDQNFIIRLKDYVVFREHLIMSFELLTIYVYEFLKANDFKGVNDSLLRKFSIQILHALKF